MRTGKIARLPHDIREQLNRRLNDGEQAHSILERLNSVPEVQAVLAASFDGRPLNKVNLTEWRHGGYRDWLVRQDALDFVEELDDKEALGHESLSDPIGARLAHWVALHYAASAKALIANEPNPSTKWTRLRELCADVTRLRRSELAAERLDLEHAWLDLEHADRQETLKNKLSRSQLLANCLEDVLRRPKAPPANQAPNSPNPGEATSQTLEHPGPTAPASFLTLSHFDPAPTAQLNPVKPS